MSEDEIQVPFLSHEDLRDAANGFLANYHPGGSIPVPIEEIVDLKLRLNVIPAPGLHRLLDTDGFLTSDLTDLWVDENIYLNYPGRYRFTLAHEVGHWLLHREIYRSRSFSTIKEWKQFVDSIPEEQHGWLEWQGYAFASLVLVPKGPLLDEARHCVARIRSQGICLEDNADFAWMQIAAFLAKRFEVSTAVVEKRLRKDGIPEALQ